MAFFRKRSHVYNHLVLPDHNTQSMLVDQFDETIETWANTRPGLDSVWPTEGRLMSPQSRAWTVPLSNAIEEGCESPIVTHRVGLTPAIKPGEFPLRVEGCRLLHRLSFLYRGWARTRRRDATEDCKEWITEGYFTCQRGKSVSDAPYSRSAQVENAVEAGGGTGDYLKYYDLIVQPMTAFAAKAVGINPKVVDAEFRMLMGAMFYICFVSGFDQFVSHLRGFFQGSPMSEVFLGALFFRWHWELNTAGAHPRMIFLFLSLPGRLSLCVHADNNTIRRRHSRCNRRKQMCFICHPSGDS